jgi:hypothetical protein
MRRVMSVRRLMPHYVNCNFSVFYSSSQFPIVAISQLAGMYDHNSELDKIYEYKNSAKEERKYKAYRAAEILHYTFKYELMSSCCFIICCVTV